MSTPRAWSYGAVSPSLQKRVDLESYQRSAKTLRNIKVIREGGLETRPGTTLVAPVKYSSNDDINTAIRRFVFNSADGNTYAIEVGHEYMRFHKNGEQIRDTTRSVQSITNASPGVVHFDGSNMTEGAELYLTGVSGMREVNNLRAFATNVNNGANTFELYDFDGNPISTTSFGTYLSGGYVGVVYEIATTYIHSDVYDLIFSQLNDVISITGGDYPPATLTRTADTDWALAYPYEDDPRQTSVVDLAGVAGSGGSKTFKYKVASIALDTNKESLPGMEPFKTVTGITNASPPVVSVTAHGFSDGDTVVFNGVGGMTEVNGREFTIRIATPYVPDTPITIAGGGGITLANPMVVDVNAFHGLSDGDKITFNIVGTTELNDITYATVTASTPTSFQAYYFGTTTLIDSRVFTAFVSGTITRISPNPTSTNSFELVNADSTNWGVFSGGTPKVARTTLYINGAGDPSTSAPHVLTWGVEDIDTAADMSSGVSQYVVYREVNGVFGFVGLTTAATFSDVGITPDTSDSPQAYTEYFRDPFDYPYCTGFGKQRLWYGGSDNHPNRCVGSQTGDYFNFFVHSPSVASDAITIDVVAGSANIIRNIKEVAGRMIAFASEGEFGLGDTDGVVDATNPDAQHFSSHGSTKVQPLLINDIATYVQASGTQVRDLGFSFESNNYKGEERSIRSQHFFRGHSIVDWCYQQTPDSVIWAIRDDGKVLGCTYVREEQMAAWHEHDWSDGDVLSACSIPGSGQDDVYMVVRHTIDGATQTFVEVMAPRLIDDIVDGVFSDATIVYDGRNTGATQLKLTGGSTWAAGESMTCQADTAYFDDRAAENVGNSVFLYDTDGSVVKCRITAYTNSTHVTVLPDRDVPASMQDTYTTDWSYAQPYADGLQPLEGATVSVFADGFVEASPNNAEYGTPLTVTDGRVELSQAYAVIAVGLPFTCDFEPLDIDSAQAPGGGLINRQKVISKLWVAVEDTRGLFIGSEPPEDDDTDPLENLQPLQRREVTANYDDPPELVTDTLEQDSISSWNSHGRCFVRQVDPLPARILAVMLEGSTGGA